MKRKRGRKGKFVPGRRHGEVDRFPAQRSFYHEEGYRLSEADKREAAAGRSIFIRGRVVARVEYACRVMGRDELFFYYLSRPGSFVIEELYIPCQGVSSTHCEVEPTDVIKAGREIRALGYRVFSAGHSHGFGGAFSSHTDWEQAEQMFVEAAARQTVMVERFSVTGKIVRGKDGASRLRAVFPGGAVIVEAGRRDGEAAAGETVTFWVVNRMAVSSFGTTTAKGEHIFPAFEVVLCPVCGAKRERRRVDPSEIAVHVIGPVTTSESEREVLRREIDERVTRSWTRSWSGGTTYGSTYKAAVQPVEVSQDAASDSSSPAPFTVTRYGAEVGTVEAAVLEEAAAKVPALARALGWKTDSD